MPLAPISPTSSLRLQCSQLLPCLYEKTGYCPGYGRKTTQQFLSCQSCADGYGASPSVNAKSKLYLRTSFPIYYSPGCIPRKSYAKDTPRVSKFHAKCLIRGQNPTPICRGMLLRKRGRKTLVTSGNDFASRSHIMTDMPAPSGMNVQARVTPKVVLISRGCRPKTLIPRRYAAKC